MDIKIEDWKVIIAGTDITPLIIVGCLFILLYGGLIYLVTRRK